MEDTLARPFTAASFNQFLAEKKLMGSHCLNCGALYLPPRALCSRCFHERMEWVEIQGKGRLAAFTSIFVTPTAMNKQGYGRENPYCSGIVELEEGVKISARILGVDARNPSSIKIGTSLQVEFLEPSEGEKPITGLAFKV